MIPVFVRIRGLLKFRARAFLLESPGSRFFFAWLPVCVNYNKPARGSVSLI